MRELERSVVAMELRALGAHGAVGTLGQRHAQAVVALAGPSAEARTSAGAIQRIGASSPAAMEDRIANPGVQAACVFTLNALPRTALRLQTDDDPLLSPPAASAVALAPAYCSRANSDSFIPCPRST